MSCGLDGDSVYNTMHIFPGQSTQYLVKWKGLGYDECTWESDNDLLPKFAAELARFQAVRPIADEHAARKSTVKRNLKNSQVRSLAYPKQLPHAPLLLKHV